MRESNQRTRQTRRPRRLEEVSRAEVGLPIVWVMVGAVAGLLVIGLVALGVVNIVRKQSITPTPSVLPGLAPTQPVAAATSDIAATPTIPPVVTLPPTPTSPPTPTPVPTVPAELTVNTFARVVGTEGAGVSLRAGPGTNNARLDVLFDDTIVPLLDGPREDENAEDFTWWLVRSESGTEGWVVEDFLVPSLPPATAGAPESETGPGEETEGTGGETYEPAPETTEEPE